MFLNNFFPGNKPKMEINTLVIFQPVRQIYTFKNEITLALESFKSAINMFNYT